MYNVIVMTREVEKMYREIVIKCEDGDLQTIVWRENVDQAIKHYKLNTVTSGTTSAYFLGVRCLQQANFL